jgi:hypothetical protein
MVTAAFTGHTLMRFVLLSALALLSACVTPPDVQVPPFARIPYEAISRDAVVAIALREWRLFGSQVDGSSGPHQPALPEDKPERQQGLWQRIGEYWWLGTNAGAREAAWTGRHGTDGIAFPASMDGRYAWSAAFVSYVMRLAGAGARFPYSASHSDYIDIAKKMAVGLTTGWLIVAERPEGYAPQPGDLICFGRGSANGLHYDDLPAGQFPGHCDIVVDITLPLQIAVVGGNIDDSVTLKHVPVTQDGRLAAPDGQIVDSRYQWMVVLRLLLTAPVAQFSVVATAVPSPSSRMRRRDGPARLPAPRIHPRRCKRAGNRPPAPPAPRRDCAGRCGR